MNATFKAQIRERLLSERAALAAQLSDLRGGALSRVEGAQGLALQPGDSPAQNATERDLHYAIDDHDSREIVLIDAALARLDIGDYGQCISCGNCSTFCEMGIDVRHYAQRGQDVVRASCVGCGICAAVCPRGVLRLEGASADIDRRAQVSRAVHVRVEDVKILG